jgi:crotonobetainyl-CoA:carnitine CoA-transferase CaiB-like acyl-CoA transferase
MSGIRIIELADYIFVPAAGGILSDWGADVIKIEHHVRGDAFRAQPLPKPESSTVPDGYQGVNAIWELANRGKRSLALNLADPDGREVLYRLVTKADVFLTNRLATVLEKLGCDVETLRRHNPRLIYVRGSGHGVRGPESGRGGFDAIDFWYRTGIAQSVKAPEVDNIPGMPAGAFGDLTGGNTIAGGISAALFHRERTGEALTVDVSLLGTGMWSLGAGISISSMVDAPFAQRAANATVRNPLTTNYRTSDSRWIAMCCLQFFRYWPEVCRIILERDELVEDDGFNTPEDLLTHGDEASKLMAEAFAGRTLAEWLQRLESFTGQYSIVQDSLSVTSDAQAVANGYTAQMPTSVGPPLTVVTPPVQFNEQVIAPAAPPRFNEHCDEILTDDLEMSMDEVIELKARDVLA